MSEEKPKRVLNQGSKYEESSTDAPPKKPKTKVLTTSKEPPQIPIKLLAIVGAILVISVAAYFLFFKGDSGKEVIDEEDVDLTEVDSGIIDDDLIISFAYTEDEWAMLREAGYTDADIIQYETNQTEASYLLEQANSALDEEIKSRYLELREEAMTAGSPEYQNLLKSTWLGLEAKTLVGNHEDLYDQYEVKENVSYVKIGMRGAQPHVKLESYKYGTLYVTPDVNTYLRMRDSGNVVITYNVTQVNGVDVVSNVFLEIVDEIPDMDSGE